MSWQIALFIYIFAFSTASLLQRSIAKKKNVDPISLSVTLQVLAGILLGVVVLIRGFDLSGIFLLWLSFALMILLHGVGNICRYKALKEVKVSEFSIIYQISTVTAVVAAIALLNENFLFTQVVGLVLVLIAALMVTWKNTKIRFSKGELYALLTAILFGLAFVNDAYILRSFDALTFTFLAFLIPGLLTGVIYRRKINISTFLERQALARIGPAVVFDVAATLSIYIAYQIGRNAAQISSISPTTTIVVVILAAIFLREREQIPKKIIAAALSVVGVILLG